VASSGVLCFGRVECFGEVRFPFFFSLPEGRRERLTKEEIASSVDLSNAYHGLSTYSLPVVFALTFLSNFSLPVLSSLSLSALLSSAPSSSRRLIHRYITAFHVLATACLCTSAWWFKSHLFSMTVFAPAVLVRAVWVVDLQVGTNLGLARALMG
jgi:hypothetical protein